MSPKGILRVNIGSQKGARQVNLGHGSLFYAKFSVRAGRTLEPKWRDPDQVRGSVVCADGGASDLSEGARAI